MGVSERMSTFRTIAFYFGPSSRIFPHVDYFNLIYRELCNWFNSALQLFLLLKTFQKFNYFFCDVISSQLKATMGKFNLCRIR